MGEVEFIGVNGEFKVVNAENYSGLYFPIAQDKGIKSCVTPNFGGDSKTGQNSFLLEPTSIENLNNNRGVRNFWVNIDGKGVWSVVGASAKQEYEKFTDKQDETELTAGFMWQNATRKSKEFGLSASVLSYVPLCAPVEIMFVTIENEGSEVVSFVPTAAIPIYGRSADNMRDHRHVTSLLHRIKTTDCGVLVKPTLSFDERGHRKNELTYFVCGVSGEGENPLDFYADIDSFMGEGGTLTSPRAVMLNKKGLPAGMAVEGKEALGGLHFERQTLLPGEKISYTVMMGVTDDESSIDDIVAKFDTAEKVIAQKEKVANYWNEQVNVGYKTGDESFDGFMKWVSFQPFLRRIFGCSFLPHHDYGRGGRGWRDLWQDCLSLLIMDPSGVRQMIVDNYGGVRIDGTNATIIGENQGQFIADRNGIPRVWMDHGVWPFLTTMLYINQTGDVDVLLERAPYFKDKLAKRGTEFDEKWNEEYGVCQRTEAGDRYEGTILEHILLEQLCAFYEVGDHNIIKLRGADWNDALDMAAENGESVAFTCAYAGNLSDIADLLETLNSKYGWGEVKLLKEIEMLITAEDSVYDDIEAKRELLANYSNACAHNVNGGYADFDIKELAVNLRRKSDWIKNHVRKTQWISGDNEGWFNSYYDNNKNAVEGYFESGVRMMLTGQVFSVMSKTATDEQVADICKSADNYLYKKEIGGYRLNTNFHEEKFDLGRMFGFAYGEKENGAVFSHMTVMYANALYQRGFAKEGYKALQTLADTAMNFETSKIYPGVPEYFDGEGRGLYHYLTGAASWYMLTFITEVFGVKGKFGALTVAPKLLASQFDEDCKAVLTLRFADKAFEVVINNPKKLEYGNYRIINAVCDNNTIKIQDGMAVIEKNDIAKLDESTHTVIVTLG